MSLLKSFSAGLTPGWTREVLGTSCAHCRCLEVIVRRSFSAKIGCPLTNHKLLKHNGGLEGPDRKSVRSWSQGMIGSRSNDAFKLGTSLEISHFEPMLASSEREPDQKKRYKPPRSIQSGRNPAPLALRSTCS